MAELVKPTGLSSKALQIGNALAPAMGTIGGWMSAPRHERPGDMGGQLRWIMARLKNFKIADPMKTTERALSMPNLYPIGAGASLAGVGYLFKMIGDVLGGSAGTAIKGMGRMAYNGGAALAVNSLVASYVYEAMHNPHPMGSAGYGPGDRNTIDLDNPQILDVTSAGLALGFEEGMGVNL